jgi:hypothetical protein
MNNVETLLQKYFDAETSLQEEALLKNYFLTGDVSKSLEKYRYLFVSLRDQRKECLSDLHFDRSLHAKLIHKRHSLVHHVVLWSTAVAASFFLALGCVYYIESQNNYMIVNGQRINDPEKALMIAATKLHLVTGNFNSSLAQVEKFGRVGKHLSVVALFQQHDTLSNSNDSVTIKETITKNEN